MPVLDLLPSHQDCLSYIFTLNSAIYNFSHHKDMYKSQLKEWEQEKAELELQVKSLQGELL